MQIVNTIHHTIPYIGPFPSMMEGKMEKLVKTFCTDLDIRLVFIPFKTRSLFRVKDPIPTGLCLQVVYKFSCTGCSACYVGETMRHSHIFKHLGGSENCFPPCISPRRIVSRDGFPHYQLKIKEAMHILWEQPSLKMHVKDVRTP